MTNPLRPRGIVLVFVSGMLAVLALVSIAVATLGMRQGKVSLTVEQGRAARLAAQSGLEYAGTRIGEDSYPATAHSADRRGDDWLSPEPVPAPVEQARHPSYSHGEPWVDANGDALYQPAETFTDLDGDGRFSAWSGRLRGGKAAFDTRFSLAAGCQDGKIPVNAGCLLDEDLHGANDTGPNGIRDYKDPVIDYHQGLSQVLDNLGVELFPVGSAPGRGQRFIGNQMFGISRLGEDLILRRPPGGYRTLNDVRDAMLAAGYSLADYGKAAPFLGVGPYESPAETTRAFLTIHESPRFPQYVPINLFCARREVIKSLFTNIKAQIPNEQFEGDAFQGVWTQIPYIRTGQIHGVGSPMRAGPLYRTKYQALPPQSPVYRYAVLYPDEADLLAGAILAWRQSGGRSWKSLYEALSWNASTIFAKDITGFVAAPVFCFYWTQNKANIAFQVLTMDPSPYSGAENWLVGYGSWGIDRAPLTPLVDPLWTAPFHSLERCLAYDKPTDTVLLKHKDEQNKTVFGGPGSSFATQGGTLAPPALFDVASAGRREAVSTVMEGVWRAVENLYFTSQEDFENLSGGRNLAGRGITVTDVPPAWMKDQLVFPRAYPSVVTLPRFNQRSIFGPWNRLDDDSDGAPDDSSETGGGGFSRLYGAVTLAAKQGGRLGASLYYPFTEDFDEGPNIEFFQDDEGLPPYPYSPQTAIPVNFPKNSDFPDLNSHHVSTRGTALRCEWPSGTSLPGFEPTHGGSIDGASVALWLSADEPASSPGVYQLTIDGRMSDEFVAGTIILNTINVVREKPPGVWERGTQIRFSVQWPKDIWYFPPFLPILIDNAYENGVTNISAFLKEAPYNPVTEHHIVITIDRNETAEATTVRLWIDGKDTDADGQEMKIVAVGISGDPGRFMTTPLEYFRFTRGDDLRLYDRALQEGDVQALYNLGRYVSSGTYRSPKYRFDAPTSLRSSQWTGIQPGNFPSSTKVKVRGFDASGVELPASPVTLGPSGSVSDLAALGRVHEMQYEVAMKVFPGLGPATDVPVFESIWFSLRRPGHSHRYLSIIER